MNDKQIEKFIEEVYPDQSVGIKYYRDSSSSQGSSPWGATILISNVRVVPIKSFL